MWSGNPTSLLDQISCLFLKPEPCCAFVAPVTTDQEFLDYPQLQLATPCSQAMKDAEGATEDDAEDAARKEKCTFHAIHVMTMGVRELHIWIIYSCRKNTISAHLNDLGMTKVKIFVKRKDAKDWDSALCVEHSWSRYHDTFFATDYNNKYFAVKGFRLRLKDNCGRCGKCKEKEKQICERKVEREMLEKLIVSRGGYVARVELEHKYH